MKNAASRTLWRCSGLGVNSIHSSPSTPSSLSSLGNRPPTIPLQAGPGLLQDSSTWTSSTRQPEHRRPARWCLHRRSRSARSAEGQPERGRARKGRCDVVVFHEDFRAAIVRPVPQNRSPGEQMEPASLFRMHQSFRIGLHALRSNTHGRPAGASEEAKDAGA